MQHLYLPHNSQLCLRNKHTQKCVGLSTSTQTLRADYPPAFIEIKDQQLTSQKTERPHYTLRLRVISRDQKQEKADFILEGSKIHLINALTDEYITCSSTGDIRFDKKSTISQEVNKHLYKASTWTVQFVKNQNKVLLGDKEWVSVYDQLCFKSVHSTYLTLKPATLELVAATELDPSRSVWNLIKANVPFINEWALKRKPFKKFSKIPFPPSQNQPLSGNNPREKKPLKTFPPQKQQILLLEDLLDIMLGFDSVYIKRHPSTHHFTIEPHLQHPTCTIAYKQLTQKILALPLFYFRIQTYINTYSMQQGIICQALCGGLRNMMKEYKMMVNQYNDQSLRAGMTLQKLWFLVQAPIKVMQALDLFLAECEKCRGGQIITVLAKFLNETTDQEIIEIYNELFSRVIKVYIQMLCKWLYEGIIEDRFGEFMIKTEEKSVNKEWSYWEEKFMIREEMVPSIFAKEANEILVTGKYLNILKACNKLEENPHKTDIFLHFLRYISLQNFSQPIIKAYEWTNKQMLDLVFNECKFEDVLKSIKGYFFLEYGDLFVHLMDAAEQDLSMLKKRTAAEGQKTKMFSQQKIQNLFELLIRTSSANNDPFKDEVTCRVENSSIYDQVHRLKTLQPQKLNYDYIQKPFVKKDSKYVDFLTIDYKCRFPLTLIFNKKSMSKYQVLFRLLFWCKFTERQLNNVWLSLQTTKKTYLSYFTPAYLLNQRMINFIKNFIYYLCYEVIEENWLVFTQNLKKVKTFEDIIECHTSFLNKCLVESLLANSKLLAIVTSQVGKSCQNFTMVRGMITKLFDEFTFEPTPTNPKTGSIISQRKMYLQQMRHHIEQTLQEEDFRSIIEDFGGAFDDSMRKLLREVYEMIGKQENHLLNLVNRLDQEKFYNRRLFGSREQV